MTAPVHGDLLAVWGLAGGGASSTTWEALPHQGDLEMGGAVVFFRDRGIGASAWWLLAGPLAVAFFLAPAAHVRARLQARAELPFADEFVVWKALQP